MCLETVIRGLFPWCFTPALYAARPDYIQVLADFVRSRPEQSVDAFLQHSNAVLAHDVEAQLSRISVPAQPTYGRHDRLTFDQFAERIQRNIHGSELVVFEGCAHAQIYEKVDEFNQRTLQFSRRHSG